MNKIFIFDSIGIHSGMKYYNDSFKDVLDKIDDTEVRVLSNYADNVNRAFIPNIFRGCKLFKVVKLIYSLLKLFLFGIVNSRDVFIILSYGSYVDALFFKVLPFVRVKLVDVHEVIQQGSENSQLHNHLFRHIFNKTKYVIYHSERSREMLCKIGFTGKLIYVPHFQYKIDSNYNLDNVSDDISHLINTTKINFLFFGSITYNKGVDILIDNVNQLPDLIKHKINIIISGKALDDTLYKCDTSSDIFSICVQHINDDEMKYLYINSDFIVLPYRETSQSGVLEMAFHYRRPVIVSNIPYFSKMIRKFPSFGIICSLENTAFQNTFCNCVINYKERTFYTQDDVSKYNYDSEVNNFIEQIYSIL